MSEHITKDQTENEKGLDQEKKGFDEEKKEVKKVYTLSDHFQLPISFNEHKMELSQNIISDLELTNVIADSSATPMYDMICSPQTCFGKDIVQDISKYYTTDIAFLKDTQQLLKTYSPKETIKDNFESINTLWNEIKGETSFCEKYLFMDWEMGKFLNNNPLFLQCMSMYNITSPILSFCMPIVMLILPFFIINARGLNLGVMEYINILKGLIETHAVGKLLTNFSEASTSQKMYAFMTIALYGFSIYQNVLICLRFYKNMSKINAYLEQMREYIDYTLESFDYYLLSSNKLSTYKEFNDTVEINKSVLQEYKRQLSTVGRFEMSIQCAMNIGNIMQFFYQIYDNPVYNKTILFSFGFHGYIDNLRGLINNISNKYVNYATLEDAGETKFKKSYYPALMKDSHVKNTCDFSKNMIVTGPNASGKTTILKSSLINVILTQQFGCGCYEGATLSPFKYIHCYLNIPDTSGRDSLFQAEARRCKTIIDSVTSNTDGKHFCAFDELYSGTNPEDAVESSISFMKYILKYQNVRSILTTHYVKVCKKLEKSEKSCKNYCMKTIKKDTDDSFEYTYILETGISNIKGGKKVLKDMNYPSEITGFSL